MGIDLVSIVKDTNLKSSETISVEFSDAPCPTTAGLPPAGGITGTTTGPLCTVAPLRPQGPEDGTAARLTGSREGLRTGVAEGGRPTGDPRLGGPLGGGGPKALGGGDTPSPGPDPAPGGGAEARSRSRSVGRRRQTLAFLLPACAPVPPTAHLPAEAAEARQGRDQTSHR